MYKNEPAGISRYGSCETVKSLTNEQVVNAHKKLLKEAFVRVNVVSQSESSANTIFDKITESELAAIDRHIYNNIDIIDDSRRNTDMKWILRCWADAKSEYLEKMFGNSLILSKPVSFQKGIDEIAEEIDKVIFNRHPRDIVSEFINNFFELEHKYSRDNLNYVCMSALIDIDTLAKNIYNYKKSHLSYKSLWLLKKPDLQTLHLLKNCNYN